MSEIQAPLATGVACGKVILFGEHAVVYGQPAIAVPLNAVQSRATVTRNEPGQGFRIVLPEIEREFHFLSHDEGPENGLIHTARLVFEKFTPGIIEHDLIVSLSSDIPQKSGFGSGAAVSTAIARALSSYLGHPLVGEDLNSIVYDVEKMHHGTPSGIDNTVIAYERPLYFVKDQSREFISIGAPIHLLVVGVEHSTPTKVTVSDVRFLNERHPRRMRRIFNRIGRIAREARVAIEDGNVEILGPLMVDNQRLLKKMTVSDEVLDKLCLTALKAGAMGAKLSGGGRGGNIIALVNPDKIEGVSQALLENGAIRVLHTTLGL